MKKILLIAVPSAIVLLVFLFFFEFPINIIRPVFHTDAINHCAKEFGIDPLLITSIVKVESNFLRRARSHRGAVGLMQVSAVHSS